MSGFTASATEALLEEGAAKQAAAGKETSMMRKIMSPFMTAIGWSPLIIFLTVPSPRIAVAGAAGTALFSFCLSGIYYKIGGTKCWPKIVDISLLSSFGLVTILAWTLPKEVAEQVVTFLDLFIYGGFIFNIALFWACFNTPFVEQFIIDFVSEEELKHPSIQYQVKVLSQMFLIGFALMGGVGTAISALTVTGNITTTLKHVLMVIFEYSILGIMLTIANWLLPAYITSEKGKKMIKEQFGDEWDAWNARNPDHEWAQM